DRFLKELGTGIKTLGDYELGEEIGRGAMGVVFQARQRSLQREVALKIVIGSSLASDTERERFHVEAEAAANLQHPNIVPIYEIGRDEDCDYYSMPLLTGGTLGDRMAKQERWSHREAVQLMAAVADAVQAAHRHGIIHRDLKPDNILLDENGEPHISDFGLACRLEQKSTLTLTGQIMGTPQ
ncbi:MAG: serine/threonine protein kinase, partial [bacterium]|nr:serine/threonine protein kinase [bacterium]